jgi:hypothetical protein
VPDKYTVRLLLEPRFFRATSAVVGGFPHTSGPGAGPRNTSLEEERREVLASVLGALAGHPSDPDELAACRHLLKRLAETAGHLGRHSS